MKKQIKLDIECGETTCASEPGKFCRFALFDIGDTGTCSIFKEKLYSNKDGWLERCKSCIDSTKGIPPCEYPSLHEWHPIDRNKKTYYLCHRCGEAH